MFRKLTAMFLLVLLAGRMAIAQEAKYLFTSIAAGEEAPYNGYLLKPETLVKIYTETEEKEKRAKLECNSKLANINLDIDKLTETKDAEKLILTKTYEELLTTRRNELLSQQTKINDLNSIITIDKLFMIGTFGAGIVLTLTILHFTSGLK